ncbi:DUF4349 domain-containing protein [Magnetovibrio sp.]|uniref:DUF4349 domain-containing protein n=1 Tax=Magnetovibrio sp. TaxID=2024836 RepID=UPI002F9526FF
MRSAVLLSMAAVVLVLSGCDEPSRDVPPQPLTKNAPTAIMGMTAPQRLMSAEMAVDTSPGPRMQIGRTYAIEVAEGPVSEAMEADREFCLKLGCSVTAVNSATSFARPTASLSALVPQDKAAEFHAHVMNAKGRAVTAFHETAQNRDEHYQDIQARLERLAYMRTRLYALADQKSSNIGELLQVERELMRVETEIERFTRDRKGVEKVTDNVAFDLNYSERPPKAGDVDFSPFTGLVSDVANTVIYAVRVTILWLARWLPAAVLVLGGAYLVRRRLRRKPE